MASLCIADLVMTLGTFGASELGPNFRFAGGSSSSSTAGVPFLVDVAGVLDRGVCVFGVEYAESPPSSSSGPNDSLPFANALRFFFGGWRPVTLRFEDQYRIVLSSRLKHTRRLV